MNRFKWDFKKIGNTNYFFKTILSISLLFVCAIILFSVLIMIIFSSKSESIITGANKRALTQLADFTDKYIFEKIDYLCNTYFNDNSEYDDIDQFFHNMQDMSIDDMYEMQKDLISIKKQNPFLNNIILYNGKFDSIVSSDDGVVYGATDTRNQLSVENRFFTYLDKISEDFYVPQDDNVMFHDQKKSIIYVHYISSSESSVFAKKNINCIIMNIDIENITKFIGQMNIPGMQSFFIMDNNNKVLIHNDNMPPLDSMIKENKKKFTPILRSPQGISNIEFNRKNANAIWVTSKLKDWKYVYIMSISDVYKQTLFVIISISLILLLVLVLGYLCVRFLSRRLYKPFENVIEKVKYSLDSELHSDNEIELLNSMLDNFSEKTLEISSVTEKYNELRNERIISNLFHGATNATHEEIIDEFKTSGISLTKKEFGFVLIEFNPIILKTFSIEQTDYILYDILGILNKNFHCVSSVSLSNVITMVINDDHINYSSITYLIQKLIAKKAFVNIYCGEKTDDLADIKQLYRRAYGVTKYSYIYGFDNIFNVDELHARENEDSEIDSKALIAMENSILDGNKNKFYEECNNILNSVKSENHSFRYAQNAAMQLFSVICRVAKEHHIDLKQDINFDKIMNNASFDNSTIYLFEISDRLFDELSNKDDDRKFILVHDIKQYIEENVAHDLSLSNVAQHFNISAGYLSKFFKENMPISFSRYVIEKKFEHAAKMLVDDPKMPVADIANALGYFDTAYFARQFKSYYGITPVQYRKHNI